MNTTKIITLIILSFGLFLTSCSENNTPVKILLAGDSTMQDVNRNDSTKLDWGWGQVFPRYFNDNVEIINFAKGGRSTRSFTEEGRWDKLMEEADKGTYIFIQFGHNDASKNKPERYTTHEQYREFLHKFITEARQKEAIPILVTPVSRRKFKDHEFVYAHGEYPVIVKEVAQEMNVPLIDLEEKSARLISQLGDEQSKELFIHLAPGINSVYPEGKKDDTHFSEKGAMSVAGLVIDGIKELKLKPITRNLKKE